MTVLLVFALIGCVATGVALSHGKAGSRTHAAFAVALVICALMHAAGNLLR